tara:strand:+ start:9822 stop:10076 length:255 start_codon:yes stop_codon:yes gene_type:complete
MTRGETVICLCDYDLFDTNIKQEKGCYIKHSAFNDKHLIYFPCNGEWAELYEHQFERVNKQGYVSKKFKDFVNLIQPLSSSYAA